jgi:hypothetical protein
MLTIPVLLTPRLGSLECVISVAVAVVLVLVQSCSMMGLRCNCCGMGSHWAAMGCGTVAAVVVAHRSSLVGRRDLAGCADHAEAVGCVGRRGLAGCTDLFDHASRMLDAGLVSDVHRVAAVHSLLLLLLRIPAPGFVLAGLLDARFAGHTVCRRNLGYRRLGD